MSDFAFPFRPSPNVQTLGPDRIRRNWLETAAFAPDGYRAAHGLTVGLDDATRLTARTALNDEMPYLGTRPDPFDVGRPPELPSYPEGLSALAPLNAYSNQRLPFRDQVSDALLAQDVGNALTGRPMRTDPTEDAIAAAFRRWGGQPGGSR